MMSGASCCSYEPSTGLLVLLVAVFSSEISTGLPIKEKKVLNQSAGSAHFDPNIRVGNGTVVDFSDVMGSVTVGEQVTVIEPESGLEGVGTDIRNQLVYLNVDWASLHLLG